MEEFMRCFNFKPEGGMLVGVERECFLTDQTWEIQPWAVRVLEALPTNGRFGYELSACQLEDRVGPCQLEDLRSELEKNEAIIKKAESQLGFRRLHVEVAPNDMPLDVYPDPTGRYQEIVKTMPREILLAACRVTSVQIHIGMPSHETALKVYNKVIAHCDELCQLGNGSSGQRLEIYKIVAPKYKPPVYQTWQEFYERAMADDFVNRPRDCWHLIRLSIHGTIEFRMFGTTDDLNLIVQWAKRCLQLCTAALEA